MRTYQAMWAIHTLFCLLILLLIFKKKKANHLYNPFSHHIPTHLLFFEIYPPLNPPPPSPPPPPKKKKKKKKNSLQPQSKKEKFFFLFLFPSFSGNYGKETFKHHTKIISSGLVGWGFPIRTESICEYVVVNIKQDQ